jgi:UDP-N-acetylglucosamine--N-acetylmuramyl-(pentapeptide) pyrophosphoryl-undecaprenol N-acetylglucosamine transferase
VAVKYCAQHGVPAAIINPDVVPGKANAYLMKHASAVCCQFDQTRQHVPAEHHGKLKTTGCPIRPEIQSLPDKAPAAKRLGLRADYLTLVITGASQGAQSVNEAMVEVLPSLKLRGWQILHLAGRDHAKNVTAAYVQKGVEARVIDFTPEMADVWAVADLAVSRAGGSTCAELTACGIASILMPYPYHKDKHQRANAKVIADAGGAVLLDDEKDAKKNAQKLRPALEGLLYEAGKRQAMARAARELGRLDAAQQVAAVLRGLMQGWASG